MAPQILGCSSLDSRNCILTFSAVNETVYFFSGPLQILLVPFAGNSCSIFEPSSETHKSRSSPEIYSHRNITIFVIMAPRLSAAAPWTAAVALLLSRRVSILQLKPIEIYLNAASVNRFASVSATNGASRYTESAFFDVVCPFQTDTAALGSAGSCVARRAFKNSQKQGFWILFSSDAGDKRASSRMKPGHRAGSFGRRHLFGYARRRRLFCNYVRRWVSAGIRRYGNEVY